MNMAGWSSRSTKCRRVDRSQNPVHQRPWGASPAQGGGKRQRPPLCPHTADKGGNTTLWPMEMDRSLVGNHEPPHLKPETRVVNLQQLRVLRSWPFHAETRAKPWKNKCRDVQYTNRGTIMNLVYMYKLHAQELTWHIPKCGQLLRLGPLYFLLQRLCPTCCIPISSGITTLDRAKHRSASPWLAPNENFHLWGKVPNKKTTCQFLDNKRIIV